MSDRQVWICEGCQNSNFIQRTLCRHCKSARPLSSKLNGLKLIEPVVGDTTSIPAAPPPPPEIVKVIVVEKREEDLCPICKEDFSDHNPKFKPNHALKCGHRFCKECVDSLFKHAGYSRVVCPTCRQTNTKSKSDVLIIY